MVLKVGALSGLLGRHDEQVREAAGEQTMKSRCTGAPLFRQRQAVTPFDFESQPAREVCADFEAGSEDQAIELVFVAIYNHTTLGDPLDALALGVDQTNIRKVERIQIFVVKAWTLAELVVPGLERLGGGAVLDD